VRLPQGGKGYGTGLTKRIAMGRARKDQDKVRFGCLTSVRSSSTPWRHAGLAGVARFYSLMVECDLFGTIRLVRNWDRIGTNGQELVEVFANEIEAGQALEAIARVKRRRGYRDL
jgi:predicted DNA-binding WGR domain protein